MRSMRLQSRSFEGIEATLWFLQVLLINPNLREKIGWMRWERVRFLFSLGRCVKLHRDLYSEMVEHG
jgi:glycosyltransferase involved in cell wall biosynthesis